MSGFLNAFVGGKSFTPLVVVASDVARSRFGPGASDLVTSTQSPNTTITGGVAPYTQNWTLISGDSPTISDANALNPTWSAVVNDGMPNVSIWRVTATDSASATASADIEITLTWSEV